MDSQFKVPKIPKITTKVGKIVQPKKSSRKTYQVQSKLQSELTKPTSVHKELKSSQQNSQNVNPNLNHFNLLKQLCPSCSKILVNYLAPIEMYIKEIINLTGENIKSSNKDGSIKNSTEIFDSNVANIQPNVRSSFEASNNQTKTNHSNMPQSESGHREENHYTRTSSGQKATDQIHINKENNRQIFEKSGSFHNHHDVNPSQYPEETCQISNEGNTEERTLFQFSPSNVVEANLNKANQQNFHTDPKLVSISELSQQGYEVNKKISNQHEVNKQEICSVSSPKSNDCHRSVDYIGNNFLSSSSSLQSVSQYFPAKQNVPNQTDSYLNPAECVELGQSPFAYVTVVYSNLSAINAILLANSLQFYNNQELTILQNSSKIAKQYQIPFVVLVCDQIDRDLFTILHQVFDRVIELKHHDTVLLNDDSLGIQQHKIHLWKELSDRYKKCLFLESFTMVVGQISNLFVECDELSACVDCFYPDNFNCSVFVFEPSLETFQRLLQFGLEQRMNETQENFAIPLDEMSLLNDYFASKWKKLSFIYNFVRNDLTYTQVPAYLKFGGNIRVVNFGYTASQNQLYSATSLDGSSKMSAFNSPQQPWNFKFDLNKAQLEECPLEHSLIDNYSKFYLRCFVQRVWPLISKKISPILLSRFNGRTEWTVFELVQMMNRESGTILNTVLEGNAFTLRRKKSLINEPTLSIQNVSDDENIEEIFKRVDLNIDMTVSDEQTSTLESLDTDEEPNIGHLDPRYRQEWEDGRVDWMHQHRSDRIISRMKTMIRN